MMNKQNIWLYALLSALLLSVSWYFNLTAFIFIAFVPLLLLENYFALAENIRKKKLKLIGIMLLTFLIWNTCTTWWIWNASAEGALMAVISNAILMTVAFVTFSNIKNKLNKEWAIWLLIPIWLTWEYIHSVWDISWPWLTLGNVLSYKPNWIQWFEFTGTSGGTLWILLVNILMYKLITASTFSLKQTYKPLAVILIPIALSYVILFTYENKSKLKEQNIVIVQPNIDPYNVKFDTKFASQLSTTLQQLKGKISDKTNYLILPETFLIENVNEEYIDSDVNMQLFKDSILRKYPNLNIIAGINSYKFFSTTEKPSATAREDKTSGHYYDVYNTAIQLNSFGIKIYHKSKLVPGVELMPFPALLKPLEKFALDLGGTVGSLGMQTERTAFEGNEGIKIAPVICYESVYGAYCTEYIRNGANFIFIITNDGWWDNTPGHKQHLSYARLRAIETRRCIARSANTGISAFIDEKGTITQPTKWWEQAVIEATLKPNDELTFFVKFGDLISKFAIILTSLSLLYYWFLRFFKR